MRLAVSPDSKIFDEPKIVETPQDFNAGMSLFQKITLELSGGKKLTRWLIVDTLWDSAEFRKEVKL